MPSTIPTLPYRHRNRQSETVRYVLLPGLAGSLAGLIAAVGLVVLDVGSLGTLVLSQGGGWVGGLLLAAGFVITFGSAAIGGSIMSIGQDDDATTE